MVKKKNDAASSESPRLELSDDIRKKLEGRREELSQACMDAVMDCLSGKNLSGPEGALNGLVGRILNIALQAECDSYMEQTRPEGNRRNGVMPKTIESQYGDLEVETPRDRDGGFKPQIVKKREMKLAEGLSEQILSLYANGLSTRNISDTVKNIYGVSLSATSVSHVTDMINDEIQSWKESPLDPVYVIVWLDAVHYKVREGESSKSRAIYNVVGIDIHGKKRLLGMYIDHSEGANFWRGVLDNLKSRGLEDILIACVDGLTGFPDAIRSVYPEAAVQLCIVHQLRNTSRLVGTKYRKEVLSDMSRIHQSATKEAAKDALEEARAKWEKRYPKVFESWDSKWNMLTCFLDFSGELRRLMYTTNPIESYHSQIRRSTKTRGCFPSDASLEKLVYLKAKDIQKKWDSKTITHWNEILKLLQIKFGDRIK